MQIHIVLCTDEHYLIPCGVTIYSICYNNKKHDLHFHILTEEVKDEQKNELEFMVKNFHQTIYFYKVDESLLGNVPVDNRFRKSIYYRLLMANILPSNINKILYLDSDIIVRGNLEEIWNYDISNFELGAVLDQNCDDIRNYNRTGLIPYSGYYNSGVLLVNLEYWRKNKTGEKCINYINKNPEQILYPDQDALNVITQNNWLNLPFHFNVQAFMYYRQSEIIARTEYINRMIEASTNPLIIHFTEARKPWMIGCEHPFISEYFKYKKLSPWHNVPLIKKKDFGRIDNILNYIKKICIFIGISKPQYKYSRYRIFNNPLLTEYKKK